MVEEERIRGRPRLSLSALVSFVASFIVARTFTTFYPNVVLLSGDYHIHHFWFGIVLLALGGWLGISYEDERLNRLAAILFGSGGGILVDEVGLLLTLNDYWTGITYTAFILILACASFLMLLFRYSKIIRAELTHFTKSNTSLYLGIFVAAVSVAFILETDNMFVIAISGGFTLMAFILILSYFVQHIVTKRQQLKRELNS